MVNFAAFFKQFLGYIITLLIILVVAAVGFIVGFFLRKKLDEKKAADTPKSDETDKNTVSN